MIDFCVQPCVLPGTDILLNFAQENETPPEKIGAQVRMGGVLCGTYINVVVFVFFQHLKLHFFCMKSALKIQNKKLA